MHPTGVLVKKHPSARERTTGLRELAQKQPRVLVGMIAASGFTLLAYNILHKQPLHPLHFGVLTMVERFGDRYRDYSDLTRRFLTRMLR